MPRFLVALVLSAVAAAAVLPERSGDRAVPEPSEQRATSAPATASQPVSFLTDETTPLPMRLRADR